MVCTKSSTDELQGQTPLCNLHGPGFRAGSEMRNCSVFVADDRLITDSPTGPSSQACRKATRSSSVGSAVWGHGHGLWIMQIQLDRDSVCCCQGSRPCKHAARTGFAQIIASHIPLVNVGSIGRCPPVNQLAFTRSASCLFYSYPKGTSDLVRMVRHHPHIVHMSS